MTETETNLEREIAAAKFAAQRLEDPEAVVEVLDFYTWSDWKGRPEPYKELERYLEPLDLLIVKREQAIRTTFYDDMRNVEQIVDRFPEEFRVADYLYNVSLERVQIWTDYPNDFLIELRVRLEEGVDAVITYECEEAGAICQDCVSSGKSSMHSGESCEHHRGESDIRTRHMIKLIPAAAEL